MLTNPWQQIALDVYESHMSDEAVGQLERLRRITFDQVRDHPARTIGMLGIAGGNGLDVIDADAVDAVHGYDVNGDYLDACAARYRDVFGDRLHLSQCLVERTLIIDQADLLIANLIIEYVGVDEFVAFAALNAPRIGVLSCVTQQNRGAGIVSATAYASAFVGLDAIACEVDPQRLSSAMTSAGFEVIGTTENLLPNGKILTRRDSRPTRR
jgi:hypothetical protein